jgi:uncharacterized protein YodC (DUF2158 family)
MSDAMFEIGDTVTLNGGGHLMTVISVDGESVSCAWSVRNDIKEKSFPARTLKKSTVPLTLRELVKGSFAAEAP